MKRFLLGLLVVLTAWLTSWAVTQPPGTTLSFRTISDMTSFTVRDTQTNLVASVQGEGIFNFVPGVVVVDNRIVFPATGIAGGWVRAPMPIYAGGTGVTNVTPFSIYALTNSTDANWFRTNIGAASITNPVFTGTFTPTGTNAYSWPSDYGNPGDVLSDNGFGLLSWVPYLSGSTTGLVTVDTITDLIAVDPATTTNVYVLGYNAANDGGGGVFYYDSATGAGFAYGVDATVTTGGADYHIAPATFTRVAGGTGYSAGAATVVIDGHTIDVSLTVSGGVIQTITYVSGTTTTSDTTTVLNVVQVGGSSGTCTAATYTPIDRVVVGGGPTAATASIYAISAGVATACRFNPANVGSYTTLPGVASGNFKQLVSLTDSGDETSVATITATVRGLNGTIFASASGGFWRRELNKGDAKAEWWGAIPDDGIDDAAALQAGLDYCMGNHGVDSYNLFLPAGALLLDSGLSAIPAATGYSFGLIGQGSHSTKLYTAQTNIAMVTAGHLTRGLDYTRISGLYFLGPCTGRTNAFNRSIGLRAIGLSRNGMLRDLRGQYLGSALSFEGNYNGVGELSELWAKDCYIGHVVYRVAGSKMDLRAETCVIGVMVMPFASTVTMLSQSCDLGCLVPSARSSVFTDCYMEYNGTNFLFGKDTNMALVTAYDSPRMVTVTGGSLGDTTSSQKSVEVYQSDTVLFDKVNFPQYTGWSDPATTTNVVFNTLPLHSRANGYTYYPLQDGSHGMAEERNLWPDGHCDFGWAAWASSWTGTGADVTTSLYGRNSTPCVQITATGDYTAYCRAEFTLSDAAAQRLVGGTNDFGIWVYLPSTWTTASFRPYIKIYDTVNNFEFVHPTTGTVWRPGWNYIIHQRNDAGTIFASGGATLYVYLDNQTPGVSHTGDYLLIDDIFASQRPHVLERAEAGLSTTTSPFQLAPDARWYRGGTKPFDTNYTGVQLLQNSSNAVLQTIKGGTGINLTLQLNSAEGTVWTDDKFKVQPAGSIYLQGITSASMLGTDSAGKVVAAGGTKLSPDGITPCSDPSDASATNLMVTGSIYGYSEKLTNNLIVGTGTSPGTTMVDIGPAANTTNALVVNGGVQTGANTPVATFSQTWNNSGIGYAGVLVRMTNTASADGSYPLIVQCGPAGSLSSVFWVNKVGSVSTGAGINAGGNLILPASGVVYFGSANNGSIRMPEDSGLQVHGNSPWSRFRIYGTAKSTPMGATTSVVLLGLTSTNFTGGEIIYTICDVHAGGTGATNGVQVGSGNLRYTAGAWNVGGVTNYYVSLTDSTNASVSIPLGVDTFGWTWTALTNYIGSPQGFYLQLTPTNTVANRATTETCTVTYTVINNSAQLVTPQ